MRITLKKTLQNYCVVCAIGAPDAPRQYKPHNEIKVVILHLLMRRDETNFAVITVLAILLDMP